MCEDQGEGRRIVSDFESDYPDYTQTPGYEPGDEPPSNRSGNPTFYNIIEEACASRRNFIFGGLASAVVSVFGVGLSGGAALAGFSKSADLLGFAPVPVSAADTVAVPDGYRVQILAAWGDPILGSMPAYDGGNSSGTDQAAQVGTHHDGMHFFPIDGSSQDGLIVVNHEYVEPRFLHAAYAGKKLGRLDVIVTDGRRDPEEVLKELNAHGVSIYRTRKDASGAWNIIEDRLNRRITGRTEMALAGPVRGSDHVVTKFSPEGTRSRGTLANCAHGVTPWNTYMAAEENWALHFISNTTRFFWWDGRPREHTRYGVSMEPMSLYGWELAEGSADEYIRFDATEKGATALDDYRNEPNTFGWMVEIDPFDPDSTPVKRTHLGRFAHEGVVFAPANPGQPVVCYSGDDARFEYIYKFVSEATFDPQTTDGSILDAGTLYAAKFNADGSGQWLALAPGRNGLTPDEGFEDLADILVNTRLAADKAGATKMDRPEWGAVDPNTGEVYFTLSNNTRRTEEQVDPVNPRAKNQFGQIVRWTEAGGDHSATSFSWELFVLAGNKEDSRVFTGQALDEDNIFACPDGLWFDAQSRLWIHTDIDEKALNKGDWASMGNNQLLAADPRTGEIRRFLTGPIGQEITGVVTTPDQRTMFLNVQHPGETTSPDAFAVGKYDSNFPDGDGAVPRSCTLVVTREDGGVIGA